MKKHYLPGLDGSFCDTPVKPLQQKYFCFSEMQIRRMICHPIPSEGRIMIVAYAGWGCGGRIAARKDEGAGMRTAKSYGPDASTLASSQR